MNPTEIEQLVIAAAGDLAESVSINRHVGQLYALLYISQEPVSLEDMAAKLKISKGSASINIRTLEEWNAVKKIWVQGTRKDFYTAQPNFTKIAVERVEKGLSKRLDLAAERLEEIQGYLNGHPKGQGANEKQLAFYRERLKKVLEVKSTVEKVLKMLPKLASKSYLSLIKDLL